MRLTLDGDGEQRSGRGATKVEASDDSTMITAVVASSAGLCLVLTFFGLIFLFYLPSRRRAKKKEDDGLPDGWSSFIHDGFPCYFNTVTGECQWELPTEDAQKSSIQMVTMKNPMRNGSTAAHHQKFSTRLPEGWERCFDEDEQKYAKL